MPVFFFFSANLQAQTETLKLTNSYNQQQIVYNSDSFIHTAWQPLLYTDSGIAAGTGSWLHRKFFNEHLLQLQRPGFTISGDLIFDEYIGKSKRYVETPSMNTRGYEVSGNVGNHFYFETDFYENQGRFGGYVDSFIRKQLVIPGQGPFKNIGDGKGFDFSSSSARLVYTPGKHFMFDLGYGKNFIGDGYRSLLLSDWSYNYPYFRTAVNLGKFQYNVMWSQYISERNPVYNNKQGYFRKWSQTFLIDWKTTRRLSLSLFETVIWPDQDSLGNKDMSGWIASPIIFLHGKTSPSGVLNNEIVGGNLKYRLFKNTDFYSQFALDNTGSGHSWQSRYAFQAGVRTGNLFNINNLNALVEFNTARPYTYASNSLNTNYANNNQPLADPLGANFREGLFTGSYTLKNWEFNAEFFAAEYGADSSATVNYGSDIFKPLSTHTVTDNASVDEGLLTHIFYADFKIAYIINPATNMRIETGFTYRNQKSKDFFYKDRIFYIGIRMSFRKIAYDF